MDLKQTAVLFLLTYLSLHPVLYAEDAKVLVKNVQGNVMVERSGVSQPAAEGLQLAPNDVVKTDRNCQTDIIWNNQWGYRLLANSRCALKKIDKMDAVIDMMDGDIIVNVKKLPESSEFKVSTPTAIAGVRGTQFWGRVKPVGESASSTFAVRKGVVEITVKATGQTYRVEEGKALDIMEGKVSELRSAEPAEMDAMAQADEIKVAAD